MRPIHATSRLPYPRRRRIDLRRARVTAYAVFLVPCGQVLA